MTQSVLPTAGHAVGNVIGVSEHLESGRVIMASKCEKPSCYKCYEAILDPIQKEVLRWLGIAIRKGTQEIWNVLNDHLQEEYGDWREILRNGVKWGVQAALRGLRAAKDEVVRFCREHKAFILQLTKAAAKVSVSQPAVIIGAKVATKESAKLATKTLFKAASTVGIVCDMVQAGLEYNGYKQQGKAIGKYGNIASGAVIGAAVGGPPGAVFGALGGFVVWGVGEVVGGLVDRAIDD